MPPTIRVEVVYALADQQTMFSVEIPLGSDIKTAIQQSGMPQHWPELDWERSPVGIFSRPCTLDTPLQAGDRVEIYRPLQLDPKQSRRRRAQQRGIKAAQSHQSEPINRSQNRELDGDADRVGYLQQDKKCTDNPSG